jgi:DNA-binding PadR family transcriptional regulator
MTDPSMLILASLAESDKHGYAIMEDVARFADVSLGPGTLYGAITRLENKGWIRPVKAKDRRQPYAITAAGRRHLTEQLDTLSRLVSAGRARLEQP